MQNFNKKCPIWGTPAINWTDSRDGIYSESPRAGGKYFISDTAKVNLQHAGDYVRAQLTTWLIDQRRRGIDIPEISSDIVEAVESFKPLPVHERATRLLLGISELCLHIGDVVSYAEYNEHGYSLVIKGEASEQLNRTAYLNEAINYLYLCAWSESLLDEELEYLLESLKRRGFIEELESYASSCIQMSMDGYAQIAEQVGQTSSKQAFIAMWFDGSMEEACKTGIERGIKDAGYEPFRVDRKDHNNKIDDEIIAEIRRSKFLVADFTADYELDNFDPAALGNKCARGGVYYEAGFAHGLNIPVIFTCREDVIDKVHFDTRQYNHITWKTPEDLRHRLAQRISATIGDGPEKSNS